MVIIQYPNNRSPKPKDVVTMHNAEGDIYNRPMVFEQTSEHSQCNVSQTCLYVVDLFHFDCLSLLMHVTNQECTSCI